VKVNTDAENEAPTCAVQGSSRAPFTTHAPLHEGDKLDTVDNCQRSSVDSLHQVGAWAGQETHLISWNDIQHPWPMPPDRQRLHGGDKVDRVDKRQETYRT
jgi:hypothetical protein